MPGALFVVKDDKRYLVTARHVLFDEEAANPESQQTEQGAPAVPEDIPEGAPEDIKELLVQQQLVAQEVQRLSMERPFGLVFHVPSFDDIRAAEPGAYKHHLMNLSPYEEVTFSEPQRDLALILLDPRNHYFADELLAFGYKPILYEHINDEPGGEGAEVFTVGFPSATAVLEKRQGSVAERMWSSDQVSLPVFAFGRVSRLHSDIEDFWIDVSIVPGNSGGPVVEGDRLVGIVSEVACGPIDWENDAGAALNLEATTIIPFGKAIKAKHVKALFALHERKLQRGGAEEDADAAARRRYGSGEKVKLFMVRDFCLAIGVERVLALGDNREGSAFSDRRLVAALL